MGCTHLFLVGCPRSGTTLLQSILATHPQIASFPESHFFEHLSAPWPWGAIFGLVSPKAYFTLEEFLQLLDQAHKVQESLPELVLFKYQYVSLFIELLDTLTEQQGKSFWLEKTPGHLRHIKDIEQLVVGAKFIHLIRNGEDVVASLYEATRKYSKDFGGSYWSIDQCIEWWKKDIKISRTYLHKPNHILVKYEHLIEAPKLVITELCDFIGVSFDEIMLKEYSKTTQQVVNENELWKQSVQQPIQKVNNHKFNKLFNAQQRQYISYKLLFEYSIVDDKAKRLKNKLEKLMSFLFRFQ